ncbi:MAG: hypothetical protein QM612_10675 [Thermomonas sp.]|uniref:hypothetical protein n=1 Tax=Thermomonas sp. TaxID=1971895 RepID=UPI0039E5366F
MDVKEALNNSRNVIPAKAGIQLFQWHAKQLDWTNIRLSEAAGFRRNDGLFRPSLMQKIKVLGFPPSRE